MTRHLTGNGIEMTPAEAAAVTRVAQAAQGACRARSAKAKAQAYEEGRLRAEAVIERSRAGLPAPSQTSPAPDLSKRVSDTERAAGERARFHVYYRTGNRMKFDPSWRPTSQMAGRDIQRLVKGCEVFRIVELDQTVSVAA